MKKLIIAIIAMLTITSGAKASLLDQLYGGFTSRAKLSIESTTKGTAQPEFLVNYVEIGQVKGEHIAAIDAGVLGTILPNSQQFQSADWTTGAKIHLAPLIRSYVKLPSEWTFLGTLEIDARASYNWTQKHDCFGIVAAVPFK